MNIIFIIDYCYQIMLTFISILYPGDEWYDYEFSGFNPYDSFCVVYVNPLRVYRPPRDPVTRNALETQPPPF